MGEIVIFSEKEEEGNAQCKEPYACPERRIVTEMFSNGTAYKHTHAHA